MQRDTHIQRDTGTYRDTHIQRGTHRELVAVRTTRVVTVGPCTQNDTNI